jgi:hypothetical protein
MDVSVRPPFFWDVGLFGIVGRRYIVLLIVVYPVFRERSTRFLKKFEVILVGVAVDCIGNFWQGKIGREKWCWGPGIE